jgi:hypothetical protein
MKLYLVRLFDPKSAEHFFKVGVTNTSTKQRFSYGSQKVIDSDLPAAEKVRTILSGVKYIPDCEYQVEELHVVEYIYEQDALLAEERILKALNPLKYSPKKTLSGATECFKPAEGKEDECEAKVISVMDEDSKHRNSAAPSELRYKVLGLGIREQDPRKRHLAILEKHRQDREQ